MIRTVAKAGLLAATLVSAPAFAQDAEEPVVNQVIVYGDQACPVATGGEIVVCVRQEDPYRLPTPFRGGDSPANEAWSERVAANADVGDTGIGSCTTVGQGGQTGCTVEAIEEAYAEKANADTVRFGQIIAEERARRLSEIDETAAAEQARVEELERAYNARLEREAAAEDTPADAEALPQPE